MDYGPCPNCFARDAELSWRENYAKCKPCGTEFRKSCEDTAPIDKMAALCLDGCPRKFAEQIVSLQDKLTSELKNAAEVISGLSQRNEVLAEDLDRTEKAKVEAEASPPEPKEDR